MDLHVRPIISTIAVLALVLLPLALQPSFAPADAVIFVEISTRQKPSEQLVQQSEEEPVLLVCVCARDEGRRNANTPKLPASWAEWKGPPSTTIPALGLIPQNRWIQKNFAQCRGLNAVVAFAATSQPSIEASVLMLILRRVVVSFQQHATPCDTLFIVLSRDHLWLKNKLWINEDLNNIVLLRHSESQSNETKKNTSLPHEITDFTIRWITRYGRRFRYLMLLYEVGSAAPGAVDASIFVAAPFDEFYNRQKSLPTQASLLRLYCKKRRVLQPILNRSALRSPPVIERSKECFVLSSRIAGSSAAVLDFVSAWKHVYEHTRKNEDTLEEVASWRATPAFVFSVIKESCCDAHIFPHAIVAVRPFESSDGAISLLTNNNDHPLDVMASDALRGMWSLPAPLKKKTATSLRSTPAECESSMCCTLMNALIVIVDAPWTDFASNQSFGKALTDFEVLIRGWIALFLNMLSSYGCQQLHIFLLCHPSSRSCGHCAVTFTDMIRRANSHTSKSNHIGKVIFGYVANSKAAQTSHLERSDISFSDREEIVTNVLHSHVFQSHNLVYRCIAAIPYASHNNVFILRNPFQHSMCQDELIVVPRLSTDNAVFLPWLALGTPLSLLRLFQSDTRDARGTASFLKPDLQQTTSERNISLRYVGDDAFVVNRLGQVTLAVTAQFLKEIWTKHAAYPLYPSV